MNRSFLRPLTLWVLLSAVGGALVCGPLSAQQTLEAVSSSLAADWARGDLARVGDLLSSQGVRVEVRGNRTGVVSARQTVAALGDFHQDHQSVAARVNRVENTGGSPPRGFAEIAWTAIPAGTSEARDYVLFVSFVQEDEAWMVSEIRVLR